MFTISNFGNSPKVHKLSVCALRLLRTRVEQSTMMMQGRWVITRVDAQSLSLECHALEISHSELTHLLVL